jgi:hypothetical protein
MSGESLSWIYKPILSVKAALGSFSDQIQTLNKKLSEKFHITIQRVLTIEIGVLVGFGYAMIGIAEYLIAVVCCIILACILVGKSLALKTSDGIHRGVGTRIFYAIVSVLACSLLVTWINLKRGNDYWTNFQKLWKKPVNPVTGLLPEQARLTAQCYLLNDQSACGISCVVSNTGNVPANDAAVGFQGDLPFETQVYANSDARISLKESETLPLPDAQGGAIHEDQLAFTIEIPLLPPKTEVPFVLKTVSEDNQRACQQVLNMQKIRRKMMESLYGFLTEHHLKDKSELPNLDTVIFAQAIGSSLFLPGDVFSDAGRTPIAFSTTEGKMAVDSYANLKHEFSPKFPDLFKWKERCNPPVWTAKKTGGEPFVLPPAKTRHLH